MMLLRACRRHWPLAIGALGLAAAWWPVLVPLQYDDGSWGGLQLILAGSLGLPYGISAGIVESMTPQAPQWLQHFAASALGLLPFLMLERYIQHTRPPPKN